jgi:hypothetical protein
VSTLVNSTPGDGLDRAATAKDGIEVITQADIQMRELPRGWQGSLPADSGKWRNRVIGPTSNATRRR